MAIRTKLNPMGANGATPVSYYTLTVTSNIDSAQCTLTYDGVSHSSRTATVPEGTVISYSMYSSTYGTTSGNVTMDSNKTLDFTGTSRNVEYSYWSTGDYSSPNSSFTIGNYWTSTTGGVYGIAARGEYREYLDSSAYTYDNYPDVTQALNCNTSNYFTFGNYAPKSSRRFCIFFAPYPILQTSSNTYEFNLTKIYFSYQYGKLNKTNSASIVSHSGPFSELPIQNWSEAYSAGKVDFTINVSSVWISHNIVDISSSSESSQSAYGIIFDSFSSGTSSSGGSNYLRLTKFGFNGQIRVLKWTSYRDYYWIITVTDGTTNSSSSGGSGSNGNVGCVLYNTDILLADNTTKQAKDIQIGDVLQTYNEDTQEFESNRVLAVLPNKKRDIIKVTFNDNTFVNLTSGHPFLTQKGWASYDNDKTVKEKLYEGAELYQLEVGDKCLTQDGTFKAINSIERDESELADVYDFTIENTHTFIGNNCVLHNATTGN